VSKNDVLPLTAPEICQHRAGAYQTLVLFLIFFFWRIQPWAININLEGGTPLQEARKRMQSATVPSGVSI